MAFRVVFKSHSKEDEKNNWKKTKQIKISLHENVRLSPPVMKFFCQPSNL